MTRPSASVSLLLLTGVAVMLEIGTLVSCLSSGETALATGLLLGAYHAGYLLADRVGVVRTSRLRFAAALGLVLVPAVLATLGAVAAMPLMVATGALLQAFRRQLKQVEKPRVVFKNIVKFSSMCLAALAATAAGFLALGSAAAMLVLLASSAPPLKRAEVRVASIADPRVERRFQATEFLHHTHYFLYCYTFWRLIDGYGAWLVGPLFTIGWVAYFVAEGLSGRKRRFSPVGLALGHILCAACIAAMAASTALAPLMFLWFLTGVGGGTAYMLANGPQARHRERAEDFGHVAGAVVGGMLASAALDLSIVVAAIVALATALSCLSLHQRLTTPGGLSHATR